ncbi:MAG: electron transfer flavoprotein subunit alpha/FixB family protein [Thermoleophilia bacterium]
MSRGAHVLAVLVPEIGGREGAAALLAAEAGRIARALGGRAATAEFVSADARLDVEAALEAMAAHVRTLDPRVVLMLDGDLSRELAPRLALALGSSALVGCTGVAVAGDAIVYSKPVYGGWLEQQLFYANDSVEVVTLVDSALSAAPVATEAEVPAAMPAATEAEVPAVMPPATAPADPGPETFETTLDVRRPAGSPAIRRLEIVPPDYRTVDIVHATRIVAVGMGAVPSAPVVTPGSSSVAAGESGGADEGAPGELLTHVRDLADLLEGSVAATRPLVDDGHLPKERLVGQTGKTVAPELYLALGISGSPHHVAGIQGAGTILAVDRDPAAPIFQFADSGYVADLREILPAVIRRIEEWRDGGR